MSGVRRERRNGRDKIIVPSATLPDGVIMNGIKYPADEIEKSYMSLNGTLAPLGHPMLDGEFVSASHPDGIAAGWIGAHNENVTRRDGRVFIDKVIDVQRANESAGGKAVLDAIERGDAIHTSTGLLCSLSDPDGSDHKHIARNMVFDHDAILLGEDGAATPDDGVGMMVNASGDVEKITVINSTLSEADQNLDWAVEHLARALKQREEAPRLERMKAALLDLFSGAQPTSSKEEVHDMDKTQFDALSTRVNTLAETAVTKDDLTNALTAALKPLVDAQTAMQANQAAQELAAHTDLVNKVQAANIAGLDKDAVAKMDSSALNALLTMHTAQNRRAAPLNKGGLHTSDDSANSMSPLGWGVAQ